MKNIVMPTSKGQITIPVAIRKKYSIDDSTSLKFIDKGQGVIEIKIMRMRDAVFGEQQTQDGMESLTFTKPVDPQVLIDAINKIDGPD